MLRDRELPKNILQEIFNTYLIFIAESLIIREGYHLFRCSRNIFNQLVKFPFMRQLFSSLFRVYFVCWQSTIKLLKYQFVICIDPSGHWEDTLAFACSVLYGHFLKVPSKNSRNAMTTLQWFAYRRENDKRIQTKSIDPVGSGPATLLHQ